MQRFKGYIIHIRTPSIRSGGWYVGHVRFLRMSGVFPIHEPCGVAETLPSSSLIEVCEYFNPLESCNGCPREASYQVTTAKESVMVPFFVYTVQKYAASFNTSGDISNRKDPLSV